MMDRVSPIDGLRDAQGRFVTDFHAEANPLLMWEIDCRSRRIASLEALRQDHSAGVVTLRPDTVERIETTIARDMLACQRAIARYATETREWWKPDPKALYGEDLQG